MESKAIRKIVGERLSKGQSVEKIVFDWSKMAEGVQVDKEGELLMRMGFDWSPAGPVTNPFFNTNGATFKLPSYARLVLKRVRTSLYYTLAAGGFFEPNGYQVYLPLPNKMVFQPLTFSAPTPAGTTSSNPTGLSILTFKDGVYSYDLDFDYANVDFGFGMQVFGNPSFAVGDSMKFQMDLEFKVSRV